MKPVDEIKTERKRNTKVQQPKAPVDQNKAIAQLQQEVKRLGKMLQDMNEKDKRVLVTVAIPPSIYRQVNGILDHYAQNLGISVTMSELLCDAIILYLEVEEEGAEDMKLEQAQSDVKPV